MSISTLKWPVFASIAPSFMTSKCSPRSTCLSPVAVMKMSPTRSRVLHRQHLVSRPSAASSARSGSTSVTITCAPMPLGPRCDAASAPAVAGHDHLPPGEQHVRRPDQPVDRRLAGAVAVVEQVLRLGLVDGDHREAELALGLERLEPDDAGRRLLRARRSRRRAGPGGSECSTPITSAPSSIVSCGRCSTAASMCE